MKKAAQGREGLILFFVNHMLFFVNHMLFNEEYAYTERPIFNPSSWHVFGKHVVKRIEHQPF